MPQATIKYLQYVVGAGRSRQPRSPMPGVYPPGLGAVSCYAQQPPNTYVTNTPFTAPFPFPPAGLPCISNYKFAFQSVTGLAEGGQISTNIFAPCSGTVGTADIIVTNVYVPFGGGTGTHGENGAIIDAFNAETGEFCDDTFVTVNPDGTGSLTTSGNVYGWVSTEASNETITAFGHILPSNMYFLKWEIVDGVSQTTNALLVDKNTNPYAFAFYGHLHKALFKDIKDNIKEHKEWLSDKPRIVDTPVKDWGAELPKWKDAAGEGDPWRDLGDPVEKLQIQTLMEKVSGLEKQIKALGQAFIKIQERPSVGKEIGKGGKRE